VLGHAISPASHNVGRQAVDNWTDKLFLTSIKLLWSKDGDAVAIAATKQGPCARYSVACQDMSSHASTGTDKLVVATSSLAAVVGQSCITRC
jgi:hypothetical protein